jgi:hypothetical protein
MKHNSFYVVLAAVATLGILLSACSSSSTPTPTLVPPTSAVSTQPPTATATQPPTATATLPPTATATQPPTATATLAPTTAAYYYSAPAATSQPAISLYP